MGKLNTYVHVVEVDDQGAQTGQAGTFGPDDELPGWAAKAITNPDVWSDGGPTDAAELDVRVRDDSPFQLPEKRTNRVVEAVRPPTHGAGSGRDAWVAYATSQGVDVTDGMSRDDIVAAVDAR